MDIAKTKKDIENLLADFIQKDFVKANKKIFQKLTDLQNDMNKDVYTVVVLGEFKRGKSTFVNALIGTKLLPMDVLPETATINAIMYNATPKLSVLYRDGREIAGNVSYDYMKQFSAGNENVALNNISYIKIGYPCELLKNRIVLVDTPGVSDLNEQRSEITYRFVPKANAVIFLLDANSPLKATEKDFIEEKLLPLGINNILFLLNKYDEVDEEEEFNFLERVKNRILNAFKINDKDAALRDITLLPISAKQALKGVEEKNSKLLNSSGMSTVIEKLRTMIFYGNIELEKVTRYRKRFADIATLLAQDLAGEKTMKACDIEELKNAVDVLKQILSENDSVEKNITAYVKTAKKNMSAMSDKSIQYFHEKLRAYILEAVEQYRDQDFKNFVEHTLEKRIRKNIESWIGNYAPHIDELLITMEGELSKGLSRYFNQQINLRASTGNKMQNLSSIFRIEAKDISNTLLQSNALTAVGAVAAAAIVTPLLLPLVGFVGREKIFKKLLTDRLAEAKSEVVPQIEIQILKITEELSRHVHEYINHKSSIIEKNALTAYETILTDMQMRIQNQINDKISQSGNMEIEISALAKNISEVNTLIYKLEEGV